MGSSNENSELYMQNSQEYDDIVFELDSEMEELFSDDDSFMSDDEDEDDDEVDYTEQSETILTDATQLENITTIQQNLPAQPKPKSTPTSQPKQKPQARKLPQKRPQKPQQKRKPAQKGKACKPQKPRKINIQTLTKAQIIKLVNNQIRKSLPKRQPAKITPKPQQKMTYPGFKCMQCQVSPIKGVRFQCTVCPNMNFCEKCEAGHNHVLLKIRSPDQIVPQQVSNSCLKIEIGGELIGLIAGLVRGAEMGGRAQIYQIKS